MGFVASREFVPRILELVVRAITFVGGWWWVLRPPPSVASWRSWFLSERLFVGSPIVLFRHRHNGSGEAVGRVGLLCRSWTRFVSVWLRGPSLDGPAAYLQALGSAVVRRSSEPST